MAPSEEADSVWAHSRTTVARQMAHLTPEQRYRIARGNAVRLYGLTPRALP